MADKPSEAQTLRPASSMSPSAAHLDTLASPGPVRAAASSTELSRGHGLGRYLVLDTLGRGGMGVVYAAFDPELDRRIAIKVLRALLGPRSVLAEAQARLLREAKAMARLTHPNVITVHDVGTVPSPGGGEDVFVAMELVDGETLKAHLRQRRAQGDLAVDDVLALLIPAGEGLAAAHEAGLVHRDFKPDNVMVARDGRVLVLDFGLAAKPAAESSAGGVDASGPASEPSGRHEGLTATGTLLGTPAYMSPEQMLGEAIDAGSDQFSYCVTLYEALLGHRPFTGDSLVDLRTSLVSGRYERDDGFDRLPPQVRGVLTRGLARRPEDRFSSMHELLAELRADPRRRRRLVGLAAVAALLTTAVAVGVATERPPPQPCADADRSLESAYGEAQRSAIRRRFGELDTPWAVDVVGTAIEGLDRYAAGWSAGRIEACRDHRVEGRDDDKHFARRLLCYDARLYALEALARSLAQVDEARAADAVGRVAQLPALVLCDDPAWLASDLRPPTDRAVAAEVAEVRRVLVADQILAADTRPEAREAAERLVARAQASGYGPVLAETQLRRGQVVLRQSGARGDAETLIFEALLAAEALGHDRVIFDALLALSQIDISASRHERASERLATAEAVMQRLGAPATLRILWLRNRARAASARLDNDAAIAALEALITLREEDGSIDSLYATTDQGMLADAYLKDDRPGEARAWIDRALAGARAQLGEHHPLVGAQEGIAGLTALREGRLDEASAHLERARSIVDAGAGDQANNRVVLRGHQAEVAAKQGRLVAAEALLREAVTLGRDTLGAEHISTAIFEANLGEFLLRRGRAREALELLRRAQAAMRAALGPTHLVVRTLTAFEGEAHRVLGDADAAASAFERALARPGTEATDEAGVAARVGLARLALEAGRPDDAAALLQQTQAADLGGDDWGLRAEMDFALARLEAASSDPQAPARARAAAERAQEALRADGSRPELLARVQAFLTGLDRAAERP